MKDIEYSTPSSSLAPEALTEQTQKQRYSSLEGTAQSI
jgi:hypothetical protein